MLSDAMASKNEIGFWDDNSKKKAISEIESPFTILSELYTYRMISLVQAAIRSLNSYIIFMLGGTGLTEQMIVEEVGTLWGRPLWTNLFCAGQANRLTVKHVSSQTYLKSTTRSWSFSIWK